MTHSTTGWMLPARMGINTVCHLNLVTPTNRILCGVKITVWVVVMKSLVQELNNEYRHYAAKENTPLMCCAYNCFVERLHIVIATDQQRRAGLCACVILLLKLNSNFNSLQFFL